MLSEGKNFISDNHKVFGVIFSTEDTLVEVLTIEIRECTRKVNNSKIGFINFYAKKFASVFEHVKEYFQVF